MEQEAQSALAEQAFDLTDSIRTLAGTVLADGFEKAEMNTSLHEARALDVLGRKDFWTMTEFAGRLGVTMPTASHTAERLVKKRLAKRSRSAQDRRIVLISLSAKGLERHKAILQNRIRICSELLGQLTPAQRKTTVAAMQGLAGLASARMAKRTKESYDSAS